MALAGGFSRLRRVAKRVRRFSCTSFTCEICLGDPDKNIPASEGNNNAHQPGDLEQGNSGSTAKQQEVEEQPNHHSVLCAICLEPLTCGGGDDMMGGGGGGGEQGQGQALFTAQCMHSFHMLCISSNVRHGSVTCPICRAHWTQLPRDLTAAARLLGMAPPCSTAAAQADDPILRILDDSIASFRVNRRSSLRTARYDDDDPVDADQLLGVSQQQQQQPRLLLSLVSVPVLLGQHYHPHHHHHHNHPEEVLMMPYAPQLQLQQQAEGYHHDMHHLPLHHPLLPHPLPLCQLLQPPQPIRGLPSEPSAAHASPKTGTGLCLSVRLSHQQPTDVVLVASPNGPHLRLLKQSLSLVVFSLRPADRLAIVTYSTAATRALPLRRMTTNGKRAALQVIDRLFYLGDADPLEGLKKAVKILDDRTHHNPLCLILHLSDNPPARAYVSRDLQVPVPIHWFHVGFGFGSGGGFVMHEFEEFLLRLLGGVVRDTQLRIRLHHDHDHDHGAVVGLGELRGGEERRILLELGSGDGCEYVCVGYSYIEGGLEECLRTGELVVGINKTTTATASGSNSSSSTSNSSRDFTSEVSPSCEVPPEDAGRMDFTTIARRRSAVERYLDPFMARRWAKHLNGYRA